MPTARDNAISLYMEGIRDGNARDAVTRYTGARYTQHSTGVADGIEGFVAFLRSVVLRDRFALAGVGVGWACDVDLAARCGGTRGVAIRRDKIPLAACATGTPTR